MGCECLSGRRTAIGGVKTRFHGQRTMHSRARADLSPNQKLGKHSQAAMIAHRRMLVAWDDVADTTLTRWGLLDLNDLRLQDLGSQEGASFPVVAISKQTALIAAARLSARELFFRSESLTTDSSR